jgi:Phage portal protein, SPP1 Gp6-like
MSVLDDLRAAAARKLDAQAHRAEWYQRYYDGDSDVIALLNTEERRAFVKFLAESKANWCELIVNAVAERLQVAGFRFGAGSDAAWLLWQANSMDADSGLVQTDALVTGSSFVLVQADDANASGVSITAESPLEATVLYAAGTTRSRVAGYKRFADDDGTRVTEVLILPDVIATWGPGRSASQPVIEDNPAGFVGMVEVVPQPRIGRPPRSELHSAVPVQDRIHTLLFARMVSADYGANRQIWATGVKLAREVVGRGEDGQEITKYQRPFNVGADRLLVNERPEGRFGAFPGDPLTGFLAAVEQDVNHLAAITQTPPHYLLGQMVNLSADAIKAAEAGLVAKIASRARYIGEAWEEIMRLGLTLIGNPAATDVEAEVIWRDWETRSEAQRVDALVKLATLGVPREVLWALYGASPQEIARWKQLAAEEAAQAAANSAAALGAADIAALLGSASGG